MVCVYEIKLITVKCSNSKDKCITQMPFFRHMNTTHRWTQDTHTHARVHTFTHTCTHIYTHAHVHTHSHTHTHTNTGLLCSDGITSGEDWEFTVPLSSTPAKALHNIAIWSKASFLNTLIVLGYLFQTTVNIVSEWISEIQQKNLGANVLVGQHQPSGSLSTRDLMGSFPEALKNSSQWLLTGLDFKLGSTQTHFMTLYQVYCRPTLLSYPR